MTLRDVWRCVWKECGGDGVEVVAMWMQKLLWFAGSWDMVEEVSL